MTASVPDQLTGKLAGEAAGRAATELVRPVEASIVLKIGGVASGGWVSNVIVAWPLMTVPVGSPGLARMVYETKPSPPPLASSAGRKPMAGSSGAWPVAGSMVSNTQVATPVRTSMVAVTST